MLENNKFESNTVDYPLEIDGLFRSYKAGVLNLIVTSNINFYDKFVTATKLAKQLNLLDKQQRITLFKYILYDELLDELTFLQR